MKLYAIVILLISLLALGCSSNSKEEIDGVDETFEPGDFAQSKKLNGSKLDLGIVLAPVNIFFKDSLLFISSSGLAFNVGVYDRNHGYQKIGDIISYGEGPDELLSVLTMDFVDDQSFWAHDVVSGLMKKFKLEVYSDSIHATVVDFVKFHGAVSRAIFVNSKKFVTTTPDINPLTRFYEYDTKGNRIATSGEYPSYDREIPSTAKVEVFSGWFTVHPNRDKFVLAYEFLDLVEIYDGNLELLKRIQGPHIFLPNFDLKERGNNQFMSRVFGRTKVAYVSASSNEKEVWLLYRGKTRTREDGAAGIHHNYIVSIDWNGSPLGFYELDHGVTDICVDWDKRTIYGLDRIESEIYSFSY